MRFCELMQGVLDELLPEFQGDDQESLSAKGTVLRCSRLRNFDALLRAYKSFVDPQQIAWGFIPSGRNTPSSLYKRQKESIVAGVVDAAEGTYRAYLAIMRSQAMSPYIQEHESREGVPSFTLTPCCYVNTRPMRKKGNTVSRQPAP